MRKLILSMQMSLDGFIEGKSGNPDDLLFSSSDLWDDLFDFLKPIDTFLLGRVMYPDYENYWSSVLDNPNADKDELKYAKHAVKYPHIVFSKTMKEAKWKNTRIVSDPAEEVVSKLKQAPGKDIQIVGGGKLARSLVNAGLVDAYRIVVGPIILGDGGKLLFKDLVGKHKLVLKKTKTFETGAIALYYEAE